MKKCIRLILPLVILVLTLAGCQQDEYRKTITTDYGDVLEIYAYLSGNMHGTYFTCEIRNYGTDGCAYFFDKAISDVPNNMADNLYTVAQEDDTKVYELFDEYIVVSNDRIDNFSSDFDLEEFIELKDMGISVDAKYQGIKVLFNTKYFKFVKQFADILTYVEPSKDIDFIKTWALGDFTDEELELNEEYSKDEITEWCIDFLS